MGILGTAAEVPIRAALEIALPDRCAITRVTTTQDATTGGWSETSATYASGIPCRVDAGGLTPRERAIGDRFSAVAAYTVMLSTVASRWPGGVVGVLASDRLVVTGDAGGTFEVVDPAGPATDQYVLEIPANKIS